MQYKTTILYENKKVEIKTTNKALEGKFSLPDFLKAVRIARNHDIIQTHLLTDYAKKDCEEFETGKQRIPRHYLKCFATPYRIPMKIAQLGYVPKEETKNKLAERLKELRLNHEVPQIIFAAELGIARSTYASYETGRNEPDIHTLIKIADYYKVSLDYLVGRM